MDWASLIVGAVLGFLAGVLFAVVVVLLAIGKGIDRPLAEEVDTAYDHYRGR